MERIIITDLTRFDRADIVCTAGTDLATGRCLRPMPYLQTASCEQLNILPGAILEGEFVGVANLAGPHQEDANYTRLRFAGPCTSDQFKVALGTGLYPSVEVGFRIQLAQGQKYVPVDHRLDRSIISLKIEPGSIEVVEDTYKPGKIKIHFSDSSGRYFRFFPITDLGFHRYAERHRAANDLMALNSFIRRQREAYIRVGLSRAWNNGRVNGYWMQVNGVYTFPDFFTEIRSYR